MIAGHYIAGRKRLLASPHARHVQTCHSLKWGWTIKAKIGNGPRWHYTRLIDIEQDLREAEEEALS